MFSTFNYRRRERMAVLFRNVDSDIFDLREELIINSEAIQIFLKTEEICFQSLSVKIWGKIHNFIEKNYHQDDFLKCFFINEALHVK